MKILFHTTELKATIEAAIAQTRYRLHSDRIASMEGPTVYVADGTTAKSPADLPAIPAGYVGVLWVPAPARLSFSPGAWRIAQSPESLLIIPLQLASLEEAYGK